MNNLLKKIKKYRYVVGFLLLCIVLFTPFTLKIINPSLEPYPAVILPSGAWLAQRVNENYSFTTYTLYGYDSISGDLKELNTRQFLDPIPPTYIYGLTAIHFGTKNQKGALLNQLFHTTTTQENKVKVEENYRWLKRKLEEQGCRKTSLVIKIFNSEISNTRRAIVKTSLSDQKIIPIP